MGYLALFRHIRVWKMTAKKQLKLIEVVVIMQSLASSTNQSCLYDLSILIEVRITEFNHQTSASPSLVEERRGKGVIKTHLKDCCPGSWTLKLLSVDSSGELTTCFFSMYPESENDINVVHHPN